MDGRAKRIIASGAWPIAFATKHWNDLINVAICAVALTMDLVTPTGVSTDLLYAIVILNARRSPKLMAIYRWAGIATLLSVVGLLISPTALTWQWNLFDRSITIACLWAVAILSKTREEALRRKKEATEALRESKRRLRAVFDTSMDAIVIINRCGTILSVNPEFQTQFGYAPEEVIDKNIKLLMSPDLAAEHDNYLANYLAGGEAKVIGKRSRVKGQRKNGATFPLELTVARVEDTDLLFIGFMRDLTQIENETRKTEEARAELLHVSRLSDMGEMAAGLAHEVSQPLTAILGYASVGRRTLSSATEPTIAHVIEVIETQAKNAADILKRLRGFIEKRESQCFPENLMKLIEDALALASVRSTGRCPRIVFNSSPDNIYVNVDRVQILQVLVNFLRNASDAMADQADDPELVIETTTAKPGVVRVNISDNGQGIDPNVADRLFTPFITTKTFGMGVGLSLCKTIIQSHGGDIGCVANAPKGATFWFTLPIVERTETADDVDAAATI